MDEGFMVFTIMVLLISGGLFLLLMKILLNYFRDRGKSKGASLGTSELETIIQRAVEAGTASIHDRLDQLEHQLDQVDEKVEGRPRALPEAQPLLDEVFEPAAAHDVHENRRAVRRQKA